MTRNEGRLDEREQGDAVSPSKPFQMRLDDGTRARWQAAAGPGVSLARFVKEAVEEKIEREVELPLHIPPPTRPPPKPSDSRASVTPPGGKVFKGPDPKGGK